MSTTLAEFGAMRASQITQTQRTVFNTVAHWLNSLPASPFTAGLEGALHLVRSRFFNTAPLVTPGPQRISQDGKTIYGRIGAFDLELDPLTYQVVAEAKFGTVAVDADGNYTYTPGPEFSGQDRFTVLITPETPSRNLLLPRSDGSRTVTIAIGTPAVDGPATAISSLTDDPDASLYLPMAAGNITVTKRPGNQFGVTFTLEALTPGTRFSWMDSAGHVGSLSDEELQNDYWRQLQEKAASNGGGVNVLAAYTGDDGSQYAVLIENVMTRPGTGGDIVFTGNLCVDAPDSKDRVDMWDVAGRDYKTAYERFLAAYKIGSVGNVVNGGGSTGLTAPWRLNADFTPISVDFTRGAFFAETYTPLSYQATGLYALDSEMNPQAKAPLGTGVPATSTGSTGPTDAVGVGAARPGVTVSIPLGTSYAIGRSDGSVEIWTDGQKSLLAQQGAQSKVTAMVDYSRPILDAGGNPVASSFTGYISGTTLTVTALGLGSKVVVGQEITGEGITPGTTVTAFIPQSAGCAQDKCTTVSGGEGGSNGGPGTYEVSVAQTFSSFTSATEDAPRGATITQPGVQAIEPGLIVGMDQGVKLWTPSLGRLIALHDNAWGSAVTTIAPYGQGVVVGLADGSVHHWTGPAKGDALGSTLFAGGVGGLGTLLKGQTLRSANGSYDLTLQQDGNLVLSGGGNALWASDTVGKDVQSAILQADGNFVLYNSQGVAQWNTGTQAPANTTWVPSPKLTLQDDGNLVLSTGDRVLWSAGKFEPQPDRRPDPIANNWTTLRGTGWVNPVSTIVPFRDGLVVGLGGTGAVQYWDPTTRSWTELQGTGWQSGVTAMTAYGRGVAAGLANGSVQYWDGTVAHHSGWTQLVGTGWQQPVTALVNWAPPELPASNAAFGNLIVGLGGKEAGAVEMWVPNRGSGPDFGKLDVKYGSWTELMGTGWKSAVTKLIPYNDPGVADGVMVGLDNGAVELWNGNPAQGAVGWTELHGTGWSSGVRSLVRNQTTVTDAVGNIIPVERLVVGLANGSTQAWLGTQKAPALGNTLRNGGKLEAGQSLRSANGSYELTLQQDGNLVLYGGSSALWNSGTSGKGVQSATLQDDGNFVLYDSSGVAQWNTGTKSPWVGAPVSLQLQNDGNLVLYLGGGQSPTALWNSGTARSNPPSPWSNNWIQIEGPEKNAAAEAIADQKTLRSAVDFAKKLVTDNTQGTFGAAGYIGSRDDPIFNLYDLQKASSADGTYSPFASYITKSPVGGTYTLPGTNTSVTLALDSNLLAYGYAFVPDGALAKLVPGKYSMAMLVGLEVGPSLTVKLDGNGEITVPDQNLFNYQFSVPGPFGFDRFALDLGANAGLSVKLNGVTTDKLEAHAYLVPGVLLTWNTNGDPKALQLGYNYYPDVDLGGFADLTGATITPTVTPYVTGTYGIFFPQRYWIIGGWSLFDVSLGYENPVSATLCVDTAGSCEGGRNTSVTLDSKGFITTHAGILESLTSVLSWDGKFEVYDVNTTVV